MTMRLLILGLVFACGSVFAADVRSLVAARYRGTAMTDNGIMAITLLGADDRRWTLEFVDTKDGNEMLLGAAGDRTLEVIARDDKRVSELREVFRAYLRNPQKNKRAETDVTAALALIHEPHLHVMDVAWVGSSRG